MKAILFANDGCGSCRKWKPTFEKLMKKYEIEYQVCDIYKDVELKKKYDVHGIPYTVFVNNSGEEVGSILGSMLEELADRDIRIYKDRDEKGSGLERS